MRFCCFFFFFFNDTATTEIYTLSLHDALPIYLPHGHARHRPGRGRDGGGHGVRRLRPRLDRGPYRRRARSEEHTSELQSRLHLVCRLLLEKKKKRNKQTQKPPLPYVTHGAAAD